MNGTTYQTVTKKLSDYKVSHGKWNLTVQEKLEQTYNAPAALPAVEQNLIPQKDDTFVKFGNFGDIKKIIQSRLFYPTFITGLSGNGKTFSVEQACAQLNREVIRVNVTIETDEDDLIGGFRLVNGETVWHNGPVVEALQRGAVLLLDEIDLASNKILCLQSILEGKGVFLKKIGKFVQPAPGFNVMATANTKGKGSDDGRFVGTNILNEAFLERFPVTFEQDYPTSKIEQKILKNVCDQLNVDDSKFCEHLSNWADIIRKTFFDGGIDEVISTRRLVHIVRAYSIFGDKEKAIQVCVNRFDDETKQAFLELYDKVDGDVEFQYTATGEKWPLDRVTSF
jgi:midasin (ATPase involved in ribosome maturation)